MNTDDLRAELTRAEQRIADLEAQVSRIHDNYANMSLYPASKHEADNVELRARIAEQGAEIARLLALIDSETPV